MFKTIRSQFTLITIALVVLLAFQVYLSRSSQNSFVQNIGLAQQAVADVSLVRALERDVLDLQRNVLIYKESASESAVNRFNTLMDSTYANLKQLESNATSIGENSNYLEYIERMRSHLGDYRDNFNSVINGRSQRQTIAEKGLVTELDTLLSKISDDLVQDKRHLIVQINQAKYCIARAENLLYKYLITPDYEYVEPFKEQIDLAKEGLLSIASNHNDIELVVSQLELAEREFVTLTQITRSYLFLVNVVMAGSANEFLFLARELNTLVTDELAKTNRQVLIDTDRTQLSINLFTAMGILLAIMIAIFIAKRIILPINVITSIFDRLTHGENIISIPGMDRKDEIGKLAIAADVFQEKNKQTSTLLAQSQTLNTKQELMNKELQESNRKAELATASKSTFLANMSHEIRTPMNGIIGLIDLTMETDLSKEQRDYLNKVAYSSRILLSLINDILDFSKIEAGKMDIEHIPFSSHSMFSNILANISSRAREKNLNVRFFVDPKLPLTLVGDPVRISQVMLNLCSNAMKFTRNGSVSIEFSFKQASTDDAITLLAKVVDTGIGMSPDQLKVVFDSFTQADQSTSRHFGGTGLGLSIVKQLVALMQGEINISSELGKGTTVEASFELKASNAKEELFTLNTVGKKKLHYFTKARLGFLQDQYFANTELDYHHYPIMQLANMLDEINKEDAVLIDIPTQAFHGKISEHIQTLKDKGITVGFVTDTQPSNLASQLRKKWNQECLSHPFTPNELGSFLEVLFRVQSSASIFERDYKSDDEHFQFEGHVLLVEDNSINQVVTGGMLKNVGVSFDIAEDGQQAVTKIVNSPDYDMVLMDIQMPIMDGYEATLSLRAQGFSDLIICGLSANAMKQDFEKGREVGMNEYLTKPMKKEDLHRVLAKYLDPITIK